MKYETLNESERLGYAYLCEGRTWEQTTEMIKNILDARHQMFTE